jgi:hypothetical protein
MPPVLHVTLRELPGRGAQEMLAGEPARLIVVLVCLNVGLAVAIGYLAQRRPKSIAPAVAATEVVTTNVTRLVTVKGNPAAAETSGNFTWHSLQSDDLKQYIANLRAIHCPDQTIQDMNTCGSLDVLSRSERRLLAATHICGACATKLQPRVRVQCRLGATNDDIGFPLIARFVRFVRQWLWSQARRG